MWNQLSEAAGEADFHKSLVSVEASPESWYQQEREGKLGWDVEKDESMRQDEQRNWSWVTGSDLDWNYGDGDCV